MVKLAKIVGNYIKTHKYFLIVLYWPVHSLWYELLRINFDAENAVMFHCSLDDKIPFIEWFVIPYALWYLYIAAVFVYALVKSKRDFLRSHAFVMLAIITPQIYCTFVPNGIPVWMRPDFASLGRENILIDFVKFFYAADTPPASVMPSMHCSVAVALVFAVCTLGGLKGKTAIKIGACVLSVLIILSTVFIKQHSVLDLFAGVAVGLLSGIAGLLLEKGYDRWKKKKAAQTAIT